MDKYYHKINAPFMRHQTGKKKGRLIPGDWAVPEFAYLANNKWSFTEKVDGMNLFVRWGPEDGVEFGGRTYKTDIPVYMREVLDATFTWENICEALGADDQSPTVYLYGEGYGPKIQKVGSLYRSDEHSFVLFDVRIGDFWLDRANVADVAAKLGIEVVPVIGEGTLDEAIQIVSTGLTWNERGAIVRWGRHGLQSAWGNFEAEGIVARPLVDLFDRKGHRIITKIKGVDFK
jgi:hypothetical protein